MRFSVIIELIKSLRFKLIRYIQLRKYDNYSISDYFREQGAIIGENCCIFPRTLGDEPYLIKIGNNVCINANVDLHTHDGGTWVFRKHLPDLRVFGPIIIEDNCFIGEGVQILPNVRIGQNSIVGAGSVVISNVPPNSIVMGIPARRFGSIEKYKEKCIERWNVQRPPNFHADSIMNWERSEEVNIIRDQIKAHLVKIFKKELS